MNSEPMAIWVVFSPPPFDLLNKYVARKHAISPGVVTLTEEVITADSLEELRERLPPGLHRMPRHPTDDPTILECWL